MNGTGLHRMSVPGRLPNPGSKKRRFFVSLHFAAGDLRHYFYKKESPDKVKASKGAMILVRRRISVPHCLSATRLWDARTAP